MSEKKLQEDSGNRKESSDGRPGEAGAGDFPGLNPQLQGRTLGKQMLGAVIGGFVTFFVLNLMHRLGWWQPQNSMMWVLFGAFIGSTFFSLDHYERAGSRLTGRQSNGDRKIALINILVALVGLMVVAGLIFGLSALIGVIFF